MLAVALPPPALAYHASADSVLAQMESPSVGMLTEMQNRGGGAKVTYLGYTAGRGGSGSWTTQTAMGKWVSAKTELFSKGNEKYTCVATDKSAADEWCETVCEGVHEPVNKDMVKLWVRGMHSWRTTVDPNCNPLYCTCYPSKYSHDDMVKVVQQRGKDQPSGLPECMWGAPEGCSDTSPYECMLGKNAGVCSDENWFDKPASECQDSCIHGKLMEHVFPGLDWFPGPFAEANYLEGPIPHYEHDPKLLTMEKRGIHVSKLNTLMSAQCKQKANQFVGVSLYSPKYVAKTKRLISSCDRNKICCKAIEMPAQLGSSANKVSEGSDEYRWSLIAMKPAFILNQLEANQLPVVFLDTDLEFHKFPDLFMPGSWPDGPRDVALFNFWGNNSGPVSVGSGLAFFNKTERAVLLATAWAEAMAFPANQQAPDDQVLNKLLNSPGGEWMFRTDLGYLPAAYLRHPPLIYCGVDPVIDHDHGNSPGLIAHSSSEPVLPPEVAVDWSAPVAPAEDTAAVPAAAPPAEVAAAPTAMICKPIGAAVTNEWCEAACTPWSCPADLCECEEDKLGARAHRASR